MRTQECRADRGGDGAGACGGAAPGVVAFRGGGHVVGRGGAGQGARHGAAADRAARANRGLDPRRHGLSQARGPFGRRDASVLRGARQAGELPGRRLAVDRQPPCEPARGLSSLSAEELGAGQEAPHEGGRARRDRLPDQAQDRTRSARTGLRRRSPPRRRADGFRPMGRTPPCVAAAESLASTMRPPSTRGRWSKAAKATRAR